MQARVPLRRAIGSSSGGGVVSMANSLVAFVGSLEHVVDSWHG